MQHEQYVHVLRNAPINAPFQNSERVVGFRRRKRTLVPGFEQELTLAEPISRGVQGDTEVCLFGARKLFVVSIDIIES